MSTDQPHSPAPSYQPPTSGSQAPGAYPGGGYSSAPPASYDTAKPKGSSTLGLIAFAASLAGVIIGSLIVYFGGQSLGALVEYTGTSGAPVDANSLPARAQEQAAGGALWTFLGFAVYGVLGLWGFIQGIVAAVKNRGRGWGITAIVLAVVGGGIVGGLWFVGFTVAAAPFLGV